MSEPHLTDPPPIPERKSGRKKGSLALVLVKQDINKFGAKRKRGNPAWVKGVSGNPSGQSSVVGLVVRLAREAAPESMRQLIAIAHSKKTELRAKLFALDKVLEHARLGKGPIELPQRPDLSSLPTKDLEQLKRILQKAAKAGGFPAAAT
jgi:hypothetical protein